MRIICSAEGLKKKVTLPYKNLNGVISIINILYYNFLSLYEELYAF